MCHVVAKVSTPRPVLMLFQLKKRRRASSPCMRAPSDMTSSVCPQHHGEGDPGTRHCLQIKGGVGDAKMDRNWSKVRYACA